MEKLKSEEIRILEKLAKGLTDEQLEQRLLAYQQSNEQTKQSNADLSEPFRAERIRRLKSLQWWR